MKRENEKYNIRIAEENDSQHLIDLCKQLGYTTSFHELKLRLKNILKDDEHVVYVACLLNGEVVGWIHAYVYKLFYSDLMAEIGGIVVDKTCRKRGIGKELMKYVKNWGIRKGCSFVSLRSNIIRESAHMFYQKLGYENVKQQYTFRKKL